jgi:PAS domain S-box-containing protein
MDAARILWANAVGAAIFDAPGPAALAQRRFEANDRAAVQIGRIAETLPPDGAPRLERLRGFGASFGRALTCRCSRILLADGSSAILVLASQAAGPSLPLAERVRRLVAEIDAPIAIFSAEGALLHAATPALDRLAAATTLSYLGADALAADALRAGHASGPTKIGALSIERIGKDSATALVATLAVSEASAEVGASSAGAAPAALPAEPILGPEGEAAPGSADADAGAVAEDTSGQEGSGAQEAVSEHIAAAAVETPVETAAPAVEAPAPARADAPELPERRGPLRFVWQMDTNGRFNIETGDFLRLMGPRTAEALGRPWEAIAAGLGLDPEGHVVQAISTRDTFSGITIDWPVDGTNERLAVELSGLPIFDRDRAFGGYRGFGVCRDARRISIAAALRYPASTNAQADAAPSAPAPETPSPLTSPPAEERPVFTVVPAAKNVLPFRAASATEKDPNLSPVERKAFRELARQLTSRLQQSNADAAQAPLPETDDFEGQPPAGSPISDAGAVGAIAREASGMGFMLAPAQGAGGKERTILDRLPVGVLVYRLETLLYANRAFLDWTGHDSMDALAANGGLDNLFVEPGADNSGEPGGDGRLLKLTTERGEQYSAEGRLFSVPWEGETAHVLMLVPPAGEVRDNAPEAALQLAQAESRELKSILDTATDGVLILDHEGHILASNRSAEALFGYDAPELLGSLFADLFAPESQRAAVDYLDGLTRERAVRLLNGGREVIGRVRQGGLIPLSMTMGKLADEKFCAVFRDLSQWKKTEEELIGAKQQAEKASLAKSEFLAKISHEIRTPLNAIIGFSEVMMGERFGPIGNDRYRQYLKDIHASGGHLVSLLNDLLDLSKIEAGKLDLIFSNINLNELTQQCVAIMQPQANQQRIIIRTSLPPILPPIVADARSVRQIVLNLLSNSIKFTGAGGQVIVSTALTDDGEVVLRVRDTGVGMSESDIQMALEPFRQLATSARWGSGGTGLGLPLTKALAQANRARFAIKSAINAGTLVEISFPSTRVLAAE